MTPITDRLRDELLRWNPGAEKWCGKPMPKHEYTTGEYYYCPDCGLHVRVHVAAEAAALVAALTPTPAPQEETKTIMRDGAGVANAIDTATASTNQKD